MDTMSIYDPGLPQRATYKTVLRMSVGMLRIDILEARKNSMHIHVIVRSGLMKSSQKLAFFVVPGPPW